MLNCGVLRVNNKTNIKWRELYLCNIADMTRSIYTYMGLSITPTDI